MNIHKEDDTIAILADEVKCYIVETNGNMALTSPDTDCTWEYQAYDNFYIHSGAEEFISYNTIAPDGRIIEVNRFLAVHKNPGIRRTNGTRG